MSEDIPVTVAVRCRPLVKKEIQEGSKVVVDFVTAEGQVLLPDVHKAFTFDHVFPPNSLQEEVYEKVGRKLVQTLFKGYNATILAYGQTGSGKTFTMGTAYAETNCPDNLKGIIPRAVGDIFNLTSLKSDTHICTIRISFLEVYNESIFDLFSSSGKPEELLIREDFTGIKISGIKEVPVESARDVLRHLERGTGNRKTGSTNMNESSSRSHAIFTLALEQRSKDDPDDCSNSKFHLVDLAGSERAKKTGAQGTRFKEGININKGLLALGNVISALCDGNSHIPYRDSKLTRLLQDSLGGNSYTVMVACTSPADSNLEETLNTLRYADRARKIKNKPIVNKDPRIREIEELKKSIAALQNQWGRHIVKCPLKDDLLSKEEDEELNGEGLDVSIPYETLSVPQRSYAGESDEDSSLTKSKPAIKSLKKKLEEAEEENKKMEEELQRCMKQIAGFCGRMICAEGARDQMRSQFKNFAENYETTMKEVGNDDLVKIMKQKLAPMINETLEVVNQPTPNPKREAGIFEPSSDNQSEVDSKNLEMSVAISKELEKVEDNLQHKQMILLHYENAKGQREEKTEEEKLRIEQLVSEIEKLEKERQHEISVEVPTATKNAMAKMSEERRKKIKSLENEISSLKREMGEKTRLLSMKQEQERRMKELEKEIKDLKSTRVSLMRKMQSESKRMAELQRKIKTQDAKYQNEQQKTRMLLNKNKEENAQLTRKLKAAQSAKQKLETSLAKQTALAKDRAFFRGKVHGNFSQRIKDWLNQEIEVEVNRSEARKHIEVLKENRAQLAAELQDLNEQLEELDESPSKKRISANATFDLKEVDSSDTLKKRLEIQQEICRIQQSMDQFTSSMQAIHHDMLTGSDKLDLSDKNRWNELNKLNECKTALSFLFEMVLQQLSKNNDLTREASDARANYEQIKRELKESQQKLHAVEEETQTTIKKLTDKYNSEMMFLLDKVSGINTVKNEPEFSFDPMIEVLRENLKEKANEVEQLQTELDLVLAQNEKTMTKMNKKRSNKKSSSVDDSFVLSADESDDDDDFDRDPLWVKTPAQNRRRRTVLATRQNPNKENTSNNSDEGVSKRSGSSRFCSCKGNCKTKLCGCRKANQKCSSDCKCAVGCCNIDASDNSDSSEEHEETALNTTFMGAQIRSFRSPRQLPALSKTPCPQLDITSMKTEDSFFAPIGFPDL